MRFGIFARPDDPVAERLASVAAARGHEVSRVAFDGIAAGDGFAFDGASWLAAGDVIDDCDGFVVRAYPLPAAMPGGDPAEAVSAGEWWRRGLLQTERSHFALSCLFDLEAAGKPMVNPARSTLFDMKPLQLAALRRAGIPIPATLITNAPAAVRAFREAYGEVVFKPTAGGAQARLLDEAALERLDAIRGAPVIFQERIAGADVRVTLAGGKVISSVEIPTDALDYRSTPDYRAGRQAYRPCPLPAPVEQMCVRAAEALGHVLSGIDLKRRPTGEWVMLEANSAPVYLDIERKTNAPISEAIVDYLERA